MNTMLAWHEAGQHRGAAGRAHRVDTKRIFKPDPTLSEAVEMGSVYFVIAVTTQQIGGLIVGHEKEDVRAFHML